MIHLHIERLVLDGVDVAPGDSGKLRLAMEQELAHLLGTGGLAPGMRTGGAVDSLDGGAVHMERGGTPARLGRQAASAVYSGIGKR
jgi:hypothetical protein